MPLIACLILCLAVVGCDKKVVKSVDVPVEDVFVEDVLTEDVLANGGLVCSGSLQLPTGAGLLAEELQVHSFFGEATPNAAGAFSISMADNKKPQFVFARDPQTENSLLLGYVDPLQSELVNLSCESTAVGLAFLNPLMIATTAEQRSEFISGIKAHLNFPLLVEAVEVAFQADPQHVLDGTTHPELYQQAAEISVDVWQEMVAAGKLLAPEAVQASVCDENQPEGGNVWLTSESDKIVFCNPKLVYYVSSIKSNNFEDLVPIAPKQSAITPQLSWDWGTDPVPTEYKLTPEGTFSYDIYKGYDFTDLDLGTGFDLNTAYGLASVLNIAQGVVHLIDLVTGVHLLIPYDTIDDLDLGVVVGDVVQEKKRQMSAIDSMLNFARFVFNYGDNIAIWILKGVDSTVLSQTAFKESLATFKNVAGPVGAVIRGYKLGNAVIPFFADLLFAEKELRYGEFIHENGSISHTIRAGDFDAWLNITDPLEALNLLNNRKISHSQDSFFERIEAGDVSSVWLFIMADVNDMYVNARDNDGRTALMYAVRHGGVRMVRLLVEHGADPNVGDYDGWTALMVAAGSGHVEMVRLLVEHRADLNARNNDGNTALRLATWYAERYGDYEVGDLLKKAGESEEDLLTPEEAEARRSLHEQGISYSQDSFFERIGAGDVSSVRLFIEAGMDPNARDYNGTTALMVAARSGRVEVISFLVDHGADLDARNKYGDTALMVAARSGHVAVVRFLVEHGADLNARSKYYYSDGYTALMEAAWRDEVEMVRLLAELGADPNAQDNDGHTALIGAIVFNLFDMIRLLVELGADPNAQNNDGDTALMLTVRRTYSERISDKSDIDRVRLLAELGADLNVQNNDGNTALIRAAGGGDVEMVRLLVEHGADLNVQNNDGDTALMEAARSGKVAMVRLLAEHGADLNARDNDGNTTLIRAAGNGWVKVIRLLVEHGADLNAQNNDGNTALMEAAGNGLVKVIRLLVEHGADLNVQNNYGNTVLTSVASWGSVEMVRLLAEHGADLNVRDNLDNTVLMYAARSGHVEMVRFLVEHGADLNARDNNGNTALMMAARWGHVEVIDLLHPEGAEARSSLHEQGISYSRDSFFERIEAGDVSSVRLFIEAGMDLNARDDDGYTALIRAAREGHVEVVRLLVEHGADLNVQNKSGNTALIWAAYGGHVEVVRFLVEHGADLNAQNNDGNTALMGAAYGGHVEVVRFLLDHGADLNVRDNDGDTALSLSKESGNQEIIDLLHPEGAEARSSLHEQGISYSRDSFFERIEAGDVSSVRLFIEAGMDLNARDDDGYTALIRAAREGHVEVVRLLVEHGADLNVQNKSGNTALIWAAYGGHVEVVRFLVEHGADLNAQNKSGNTALMYAAYGGHVEVVRFLVEHGADLNAQNNDGNTALSIAKEEENQEIIDLLVAAGTTE